jgi:hypothetical protein
MRNGFYSKISILYLTRDIMKEFGIIFLCPKTHKDIHRKIFDIFKAKLMNAAPYHFEEYIVTKYISLKKE